MSHFTVLVKLPNEKVEEYGLEEALEKVMLPYMENCCVEPPKEFMEFTNVEGENREDYETGTCEMIEFPDGRRICRYDDECRNPNYHMFGSGSGEQYIVPEGGEIVTVPFTERYPTFGEYLEDYCGYQLDPEVGKHGYWQNPNAKWDWYQVGGRWTGELLLKEEAIVSRAGVRGQPSLVMAKFNPESVNTDPHMADAAQFKNVDWDTMNSDITDKVREFLDQVQKVREHQQSGATKLPEDVDSFFGPWSDMCELGFAERIDKEGEWDLQKFNIKEISLEDAVKTYGSYWKWRTFAAIDETGEWYEKASMGWWGMHDGDADSAISWCDAFWNKFIEGTDPDTWMVVVDCHI